MTSKSEWDPFDELGEASDDADDNTEYDEQCLYLNP